MDGINDLTAVKNILPDSYTVKYNHRGYIVCESPTGIFMDADSEDDEHWFYVFNAIKKHFGGRFQEVYHETCFAHKKFIIYFKK